MDPSTCPWCESTDTERLGDAGSLLMTASWYCRSCHSAFEVIRKRGADDDAPDDSTSPPAPRADPRTDPPTDQESS